MTLFNGENTEEIADPEEYGFQEENNDFVRAILSGAPPPMSHVDGLRATLLVLTALESFKTGLPQAFTT